MVSYVAAMIAMLADMVALTAYFFGWDWAPIVQPIAEGVSLIVIAILSYIINKQVKLLYGNGKRK